MSVLISTPRRRTVAALVTGVTAGALMLTACGGGTDQAEVVDGEWDDVVVAAKEEGTLNLAWGGSPLQLSRVTEAFNEEYPEIAVSSERITADAIARIESQISTNTDGTDVFVLANPEWFKNFEDDLLPASGPNSDDISDDAWPVPGSAALVSGVPYSLSVWNTNIFPDGFADWEDVFAPEVQGQLGTMSTASATAIGFLDFLETSFGEEFLERMSEQEPKLYPSIVPMTQSVAAGEAGLTIASSPADATSLQESGAPIEFAYMTPAYGIDYAIAALQNAGRPNAAVLFVDFILSAEGQEAMNSDGLGISYRVDGVEGSVDPEGYTMMDAAKYSSPEVVAEWQQKIDTYFG